MGSTNQRNFDAFAGRKIARLAPRSRFSRSTAESTLHTQSGNQREVGFPLEVLPFFRAATQPGQALQCLGSDGVSGSSRIHQPPGPPRPK